MLNPSTSPLKSVFDSSQPYVSILNVKDGRIMLFPKKIMDHIPKYTCFAGYTTCVKGMRNILSKKCQKSTSKLKVSYIIKALHAPTTSGLAKTVPLTQSNSPVPNYFRTKSIC